MLIKKYALKKHVRLLTRLYGNNILARCYVVTKVYKVLYIHVIQSLLVGLMSMFTTVNVEILALH